jgi:hypothetical protein
MCDHIGGAMLMIVARIKENRCHFAFLTPDWGLSKAREQPIRSVDEPSIMVQCNIYVGTDMRMF